MTKLVWDVEAERIIEFGVDRGVIYPKNSPGVAWSGLIDITEETVSDVESLYLDGDKYYDNVSDDSSTFTVEAFHYPNEFLGGEHFDLSYRTRHSLGYKIHLIYNAVAADSDEKFGSISDSPNPLQFSWQFSTAPEDISNVKPSSHLIVDSATTDSVIFALLEDQLYGSNTVTPYMPPSETIVAIFASTGFVVIDHGDGSWSAIGPDSAITMLDSTSFQINWPSATFIDADSYTISST